MKGVFLRKRLSWQQCNSRKMVVARATWAGILQPVLGLVASALSRLVLPSSVSLPPPACFCWCTVLVHLLDALADYLGPCKRRGPSEHSARVINLKAL